MNEFEKLCKLASERDWCWNIHGSPCGNAQLNIGLALIAHDIPLSSSSWDYSYEPPDVISDYFEGHHGDLTCRIIPKMHSHLSEVLSEANLKTIRKNHQDNHNYIYSSEDWLGYLGVVLHRVLGLDARLVGGSWKTQLNQMIGPITRLPEAYIFDDLFSEYVTFEQLEEYQITLICLNNKKVDV